MAIKLKPTLNNFFIETTTYYGRSIKPFFLEIQNSSAWTGQIGQINSEAFYVFSAKLSAPILVQ